MQLVLNYKLKTAALLYKRAAKSKNVERRVKRGNFFKSSPSQKNKKHSIFVSKLFYSMVTT